MEKIAGKFQGFASELWNTKNHISTEEIKIKIRIYLNVNDNENFTTGKVWLKMCLERDLQS